MNLSINLKNEFNKILNQFGHDVLILRKERKNFCHNCYDEVTREASRDCPVCLGLGYTFSAERHTARNQEGTLPESLIRLIQPTDIGGVATGGKKYFMSPEVKAVETDLIIEVDWDALGRPIYNNGGIWAVNHVTLHELGTGKPIYQTFYTSENPVESRIRGIRIAELNGIKHYNVLMEG